MQLFTILLMGPQGSGKGTQRELLERFFAEKKDAPVRSLETGMAFRSFIQGKGFTHQLVRESLERGERQPDFLATHLLASLFVEHVAGDEHLIIDGYPRTLSQAEIFDGAMQFYKRSPVQIISLELGESKAIERLVKRGRKDDTEEGIKERLRWYRDEVAPITDLYRSRTRYRVHEINGDQAVEEVHRDIVKALGI